MEPVVKIIRGVIVLMCAALFLAGALWNLCNPPEEPIQQMAAHEIGQNTVEAVAKQEHAVESQDEKNEQELEHRMAAMRIQRDASWQQLYHAVEQLEFDEKQQKLQQYAELQYQEQRLELLLNAKGIQHSLAVLSSEQANIIVPEDILQKEYEKLYDLVLRNTDYEESQIILVPLK